MLTKYSFNLRMDANWIQFYLSMDANKIQFYLRMDANWIQFYSRMDANGIQFYVRIHAKRILFINSDFFQKPSTTNERTVSLGSDQTARIGLVITALIYMDICWKWNQFGFAWERYIFVRRHALIVSILQHMCSRRLW